MDRSKPAAMPANGKSLFSRLSRTPYLVWVLLGFGCTYLWFFVGPRFMRTNVMQVPRIVPAAEHLGIDLKLTLAWSDYWQHPVQRPDPDGTAYPPTTSLLLSPLLSLSFSEAYRLVTFLTLASYVVMTLAMPMALFQDQQLWSVPVLLCATGLVSYGLQFEVERGQFSVIAVTMVVAGAWIFHRASRNRWIAYALLLLAIQLKLYPYFFILLFVSDWRDWRGNATRFFWLTATSVALFWTRGLPGIQAWIDGFTTAMSHPYLWVGNPSIHSAVTLGSDFAVSRGWAWLAAAAPALEVTMVTLVGISLFMIILALFRSKASYLSPHLLLTLALVTLLIPSSGHDYRLALLGGPTGMLVMAEAKSDKHLQAAGRSVLRRLLALGLMLAYASTLFSYTEKPFYLGNNFPALVVMLLITAYLGFTYEPGPPRTAFPVKSGLPGMLAAPGGE